MEGHKVRANERVVTVTFTYWHGVMLGVLIGVLIGVLFCGVEGHAQGPWSSDTVQQPGQYRQQNRYDSGGVTQTPTGPKYDYGTSTYKGKNPC